MKKKRTVKKSAVKKKNIKRKAKKRQELKLTCVLKNFMENIVEKNMVEQLSRRKDVCRCERCRLDIFAFALNHLPPKYVVTDKGSIYTRLAEMEFQLNADVTREVYKAIEVVKKNVRHV